MNLNNLVTGITAVVTPNEEIAVFYSLGQTNVKGVLTPSYSGPDVFPETRIQSIKDSELKNINRVGENDTLKHFYVSANVRGVYRPTQTGGDMIYARGQWWLVVALPEDFTQAGWVCVRASLQMKAPDGVAYP